MNPNDPNVQQVQIVAEALGDLCGEFLFVGGCACGLLITDVSRPPVRITYDVDLAVEVASNGEYHRLSALLRQRGFREDGGEVICRWVSGDITVDIMPTDARVFGFANRWHAAGIIAPLAIDLPSGRQIALISAPYFLASKLEAFYDRGRGDFASHDIEDLVNVIDGRPGIVGELAECDLAVRTHLRNEFEELLSNASFLNSLSGHFRPDRIEQARVEIVLERLARIAGL